VGPGGIQKVEVAEQEVQEKGEREIPEHLSNLFEKSKGELNGQEQTHLRELLCEFEDVFAKDRSRCPLRNRWPDHSRPNIFFNWVSSSPA
jgi:hypothetical protein